MRKLIKINSNSVEILSCGRSLKDHIFVKKTMDITREQKLDTLADINRAFAEQLNITDIPLDDNRSDILKRIQISDEECFSVLAAFNNAWLAYDYIRGDKELKIKVEDVWKMEVSRHKETFDEHKEIMLELAKTKKIDLEPMALRIKWL